MKAINPPSQIENQLKKEAFYGCIICGCPVLEFVNIMRQDVGVFLPENIVALCPNHINKYNNSELQESQLRDAKIRPYNRTHEQSAFTISSSDITINVGKCKFVNTARILVIDDFDIITIKRDSENSKYVLFDVNIFDSLNNLKAMVSENSWHHEGTDMDWTIDYEPRHLLIQKSGSLFFDAKIDNNSGELTLLADGFHYNGSLIQITQTEILVDNEEIALDLKGASMKNYEAGILFQTR